MTTPSYTPPPWTAASTDPDPRHDIARVREMGYRHGIAIRSVAPLPNPFPLAQGIANATVMAAGPALHQALQALVAAAEDGRLVIADERVEPILRAAREALRDATSPPNAT